MLSLQNKNWKVAEPDPERVDLLSQELEVPAIIGRLLANRQVTHPEEGRRLLNADLSQLHDPFLMEGMREAVERIVLAINRNETITLFCDYDVDGVTSAAFLTHFFRDLRVPVNYYLPERMTEGYGLNLDAVRQIRDSGSTLMITADCGITGNAEVKLANEIGLDVIITDHHQVGENGLPDALAVLNPHQPACSYPYRFLSGVGIVFKLATAVRAALHESGWERSRLPNLKRHLDLFVLGTIADMAPLTGENHILCAHGLEVMARSAKPGLVALKAVAGVDGNVDARAVGFALGPRLNAAGRLGKADAGLHLLTATEENEAMALARSIDAINTERREIQGYTQEEAEYLLDREVDLERDRVIVLASENFHPGVIGIVASRLVDKYYRPTVLIALENGMGKGSGRSIPAFNLYKALTECSDHFTQFGGHAFAAGLNIEENRIDEFRKAINDVGHRFLNEDNMIPDLNIDAELEISDIDHALHNNIRSLEPFGLGNPLPVFVSRAVRVRGLRFMGKEDQHIRFRAVQNNGSIDVVGFNMGEIFCREDMDDPVDIAYEIQINRWNGQNKVELRLLDIRRS